MRETLLLPKESLPSIVITPQSVARIRSGVQAVSDAIFLLLVILIEIGCGGGRNKKQR